MLWPRQVAGVMLGAVLGWASPAFAGDDANRVHQAAADARAEDLSFAANPKSRDPGVDDFTKDLVPHSGAKGKADRSAAAPALTPKPDLATGANESSVDSTRSPDPADQPAQASSIPSSGPLDLTVTLPEVLVNGKRDSFSQTDQRLKSLAVALPCAGCDGRRNDDPPKIVQIGTYVAVKALKSLFFSQPRVRGEPNDEALYLAHDGVCTPDDPYRCLYRPQMP